MLALVCWRNPNNVHCFGTIFTNHSHLKLAFASRFTVTPSTCNLRIEKLANCHPLRWAPLRWSQWEATKKHCCNSEFTKWHDIHTPKEYAGERMQNNADFKWLCHEWFHHVRHHVYDGHSIGELDTIVWRLTTIVWRLNSFTVSFPFDVRGESGLREFASVNRRENSAP